MSAPCRERRGTASYQHRGGIDDPRLGWESKGGLEARRFDEVAASTVGCPGGAGLHPGLKSLLGLLGFLCLLRLFRLLRFLSHSILIWVDGWKRDTRHARRRASLAISSNTIPTDSQAAASYCHACVIALSTVVMRFGTRGPCSGIINPDAVARDAVPPGRRASSDRAFLQFINSKPQFGLRLLRSEVR